MLTPYRRHISTCPHSRKGNSYSLCACPIWCDGMLAGKRVRQSLQTTNWKEAEQRLQVVLMSNQDAPVASAVLAAPVAPVAPPPPTSTTCQEVLLGAAIEHYLADCRARDLTPSTLKNYKITTDKLEAEFGKMRALRSIHISELSTWRSGWSVEPRTAAKLITHLKSFFAFCVRQEWLAKNPVANLKRPHPKKLATLPYEPWEIEALLNAADHMTHKDPEMQPYVRRRARALLMVLLYSGLRVSDVAMLRRSALNEKTGHLTLRTMKTGAPLKVLLKPEAVEALLRLPAQNPEYFFWTGRGKPIVCALNLWRTVKRIGKRAKVRGARPHRFRDTFAVELLTQGADIRTVQHLLGHDSVKTTEKHYAHFIAAHQALLDAATAKLDFRPQAAHPVLVVSR